jgi:hypothetical protein
VSISTDNKRQYCAACKRMMDVERPFFICADCLRKLDSPVRQAVLASEDYEEMASARRRALIALGAKDENDVRMPPRPRNRGLSLGCSHDPSDWFDQRNLITGAIDTVCNRCGRVRYAEASA